MEEVKQHLHTLQTELEVQSKEMHQKLSEDAHQRHQEMGDFLKATKEVRTTATEALRTILAEDTSSRHQEVGEFLKEQGQLRSKAALDQTHQRHQETGEFLKATKEVRTTAAEALRTTLAEDTSSRHQATEEFLKEQGQLRSKAALEQAHQRREETVQRANEVRERLAGHYFQRMTGTPSATPTATPTVTVTPEPPSEPAVESLSAKAPITPTPQVEPVTAIVEQTQQIQEKIEKASVEVTDLNLFAYLALNPDGLTLYELEQHFGVSRSMLNQKLRVLMENGKVRKSDKNYLAI